MQPNRAEGSQASTKESSREYADMAADMTALTNRLTALERNMSEYAANRPVARKGKIKAIRNMVLLAVSTVVLTVLANVPIVHGQSLVDALFIDANGNVGIGTSSPQRRLDITGNGGDDVAGISIESYAASPDAGVIRFGDNTDWKLHIGRSREKAEGPLNSGTEGVLMTIQDNGNVGIGTTDPGKTLEVVGNIVSRTTENGGTGVALAAEGAGLGSIWTNPSYNPTEPDSGWQRTMNMQGGNVDVVGDLTVQGNITNFALRGPYQTMLPDRDKYISMIPQEDGFCFLTSVSCRHTTDGHTVCACWIDTEAGRWRLGTAVYPVDNAQTARTSCTAMCVTW